MGWPAPARPEARGISRIGAVFLAKLSFGVLFLPKGEAHVHEDQDREHDQSQNGRPLHQKAEHDQHETGILRMAHPCIDAGRREFARAQRAMKDRPSRRQYAEAQEDKGQAYKVKRAKMRIVLPAKDHLPEMS